MDILGYLWICWGYLGFCSTPGLRGNRCSSMFVDFYGFLWILGLGGAAAAPDICSPLGVGGGGGGQVPSCLLIILLSSE